jgi:exonuclease VII small subunit
LSNSSSPWRKTDAALQRLDQAIARLERALPAAPPRAPDLFGGDELNRARQDYAQLDQASRQVEARLDQMADRLQTLLES